MMKSKSESPRYPDLKIGEIDCPRELYTKFAELGLYRGRTADPDAVEKIVPSGFVSADAETMEQLSGGIKFVEKTGHGPILLTGDTGTGKEVAARAVHQLCRKGAYQSLNCSRLSGDQLESALFGHVQGAFTGANTSRAGAFREAKNGTVLLDEIGDMALDNQTVLLRTLQENTVRPLGSDKEYPVDALGIVRK